MFYSCNNYNRKSVSYRLSLINSSAASRVCCGFSSARSIRASFKTDTNTLTSRMVAEGYNQRIFPQKAGLSFRPTRIIITLNFEQWIIAQTASIGDGTVTDKKTGTKQTADDALWSALIGFLEELLTQSALIGRQVLSILYHKRRYRILLPASRLFLYHHC